MALGAWGAAQATSAGIGVAMAGIVRDLVVGVQGETGNVVETPYNIVFSIEAVCLVLAMIVIWPLARHLSKQLTSKSTHTNQVEAS